MAIRHSRKIEKGKEVLTFPSSSLETHSIEVPMSLFPSHRDISIIPPNIIIRRITNKETNPLKAIQRFLKLSIKDNAEYSVGRKRFLATRLLSFSAERTAGGVTSRFDDAIMSSWLSLPVEGVSLSFSFSCNSQLFIICLLSSYKCLGLLIPSPALYLIEYDTFLSLLLLTGMDDDVTFLSPLERDLNMLTENCSPLALSCCPIFRVTRRRRTLETRGACEGGKREPELIRLLFFPNFCLMSDRPCLSE